MEEGKEKRDTDMTLEDAGAKSWTTGAAGADRPELDESTKQEVARIREKQARGDDLTVEEAGKLGGAARVKQAQGEPEE